MPVRRVARIYAPAHGSNQTDANRRDTMNSKLMTSLILAVALSLAGCAAGPREQTGVLVGGAAGGVLGSQIGSGRGRTAATVLGAIIGASVGGSIGERLDESDRRRMGYSLENNRTGATTRWHNPDTGRDYAVTPTGTYDSGGRPCREYTMDAEIGGRMEKVYGTACRQPDGSWKVVD